MSHRYSQGCCAAELPCLVIKQHVNIETGIILTSYEGLSGLEGFAADDV